ncbi:tRNA pseudouridine(55) synthase TruB [Anaerovorax odorimutans]|uniref:tRNA pseudouridine(55) synthase TruB n=1 Tax=Anaerovorax odorimutans TaxID=109327 RepID=UPI000419FEBA|nr:tRNA pseudouridine(55) synthase TruB [Anaerovorax odorimutans]
MIKEGIINLLKPAGMTSHDGVQFVRRISGIKRVGHTGTLDPMAVGVLPICIGSATRITEYLDLDYKKYRCEMQLGIETDTQDIWGEILNTSSFSGITKKDITKVLEEFSGIVEQIPPNYSAVKVNGKKLYEYARKGQTVTVKSRKIHIKNIELIRFDSKSGRATFDIECSKGTYVRTICHEVGNKLGCKAAMSCLIRTASGIFTIEDTITIEELLSNRIGEDIKDPVTGKYISYARIPHEILNRYILNSDYPLIHFGRSYVNKDRALWFINGGHLKMSEVEIIQEPEFKNSLNFNLKEEYKKAYNIYFKTDKNEDLFLGVAFYNEQYKKLVANKIFYNRSNVILR